MSTQRKKQFVICTKNTGAPDLVLSKVYEVLPDASAERSKHIRVLDESGEDYLYPAGNFCSIEIPPAVRRAIRKGLEASAA